MPVPRARGVLATPSTQTLGGSTPYAHAVVPILPPDTPAFLSSLSPGRVL